MHIASSIVAFGLALAGSADARMNAVGRRQAAAMSLIETPSNSASSVAPPPAASSIETSSIVVSPALPSQISQSAATSVEPSQITSQAVATSVEPSQITSQAAATSVQPSQITSQAAATSVQPTQPSVEPCAVVSSSQQAAPTGSTVFLTPSLAAACLESIPLDKDRAHAFIDWITPFVQLQSTSSYLKNPPQGYTMHGVDLFGGLSQISQNIQSGTYKSEWEFETHVYLLINVLPRDFHSNLGAPLTNLFNFNLGLPASASLSLDGESIPQQYTVSDITQWYKSGSSLGWTPSPLETINNEPAADYLLRVGMYQRAYLDPNTVFNLAVESYPLSSPGGSGYSGAAWVPGFSEDTITYSFQNGTNGTSNNFAYILGGTQFSGVDNGEAAYNKFVVPQSATPSATALRARQATATVAPSSAPAKTGYPTPVVADVRGAVMGYFLSDSDVAVLDISDFEDDEGTSAITIRKFLDTCKAANKTRIIVDLRGDGGGNVGDGNDAFVEFFPTITPFDASRLRYTPMVDFISDVASAIATLNNTDTIDEYEVGYQKDVNLQPFATYKDWVGPDEINGDNFTTLARGGSSPPPDGRQSGSTPDQVFSSDNIVILHDGGCGSTCAVFAQLMKAQGGVRSIAVGGLPKAGPMQGVTGSKGTQVMSYGQIQGVVKELLAPGVKDIYAKNNTQFPDYNIDMEYNVSTDDPPFPIDIQNGARFNLRSGFNTSDTSDLPLQFIYEAANCRLYYQPIDLFDISSLWGRVANTTWGSGKCVDGSSVNKDGSMPRDRLQTVAFTADAMSDVTVDTSLPGYVPPSQ